jgi:hypothetical protein
MASEGLFQPSGRLTDRQYAAIGRVAVLWAEAEWAMERILGRLGLVPSVLGYVLTDKLGPDYRIGAIRSLINVHKVKYHAKLVDADLLTEIRSYLPSLLAMKSDRNYVVHSVWSKANETNLSRFDIGATARSGLDISAGPCQRIEAIEGFAIEVEKAATLLWELGSRIPTVQPTSLEKLNELELRNRGLPIAQSTRLIPPKSFARLQREALPPAKQPNKKAKPA